MASLSPSKSVREAPAAKPASAYAELHCISNFSFLRGASFPEELVLQANALGYRAIAITDECSLAGVVRAHTAARDCPIELIIGSEFLLSGEWCDELTDERSEKLTDADENNDSDSSDQGDFSSCRFVLLAPDRKAYGQLSHLISCARRAARKGDYFLDKKMLQANLPSRCLCLWIAPEFSISMPGTRLQDSGEINGIGGINSQLKYLKSLFDNNLWIAAELLLRGDDAQKLHYLQTLGKRYSIPLCASGGVYMHTPKRRAIQDTLTAIRLIRPVSSLGLDAQSNGQRHLRAREQLAKMYPSELIEQSLQIARRCHFSLTQLRYEYPSELVPANYSPQAWLRQLTEEGVEKRWPQGVSDKVRKTIEHELALIQEMQYEYYFLTVHDIVRFAKAENILCQGRGSAANSVVCYCLGITEVNPDQTSLLFERFVSKERDEPPDIDVDFENARREEVIQYIYQKYGRHRAAIAATVITYRSRSAIRDVGKALEIEEQLIDHLAKSIFWWGNDLQEQLSDSGVDFSNPKIKQLLHLARAISGFPRHLSQHVGGFIISKGPLSELVPIENAAMADRSIIQWDKDDLETLGLLKVDVLALGMLTALHKCMDLVSAYCGKTMTMQEIPKEDPAVYDMMCKADTVGVFQIESRAQMSMLPRLKPRNYYDLVIQIAIVRPGPIQGDMVHPYLARRNGSEVIEYESKDIEQVLSRTLGVPIFQEQVMQLAMVAAGFSAGQADQLRRAMAAWKKKGGLEPFQEKLIQGMTSRGYSQDFALRIYKQIAGFAEYGFPESHSASFALLAYVSSWFKYYHPAAFCCALLNSQPMGFYPPSQLVQDARRHGVKVRAVDINCSEWESSLEFDGSSPGEGAVPALRLGFNRVKGLSEKGAKAIWQSRGQQAFNSVQELIDRSGIGKGDLESLAAADALKSLAGDRHRAFWQAAGSERSSLQELYADPGCDYSEPGSALSYEPGSAPNSKPENPSSLGNSIAASGFPRPQACPDPNVKNDPASPRQLSFYADPAFTPEWSRRGVEVMLPVPAEGLNIMADYAATGLSLRRHPLALMRKHLDNHDVTTASALAAVPHNSFAKVAGIVTCRQRPQTASGVTFITLEDESGFINVVVWPKLGEERRPVVRQASLMGVMGRVQISEGVIHLVATRLDDLSSWLQGMTVNSRDFC